jgi:hypothetical protein
LKTSLPRRLVTQCSASLLEEILLINNGGYAMCGASRSWREVGCAGMSEMRTKGVRIRLLCVDAFVAVAAIGGGVALAAGIGADGPSEA